MNKNKCLRVLLPHRGVDAGKARLSAVLNDEVRSELNRWLLVRTLRVVCAWLGASTKCVVISPCVHTRALAQAAGAIGLPEEDASSRGLNAALTQGAAHAVVLGAQHVMILPCDLPRLDAVALEAMDALSNSGTNAVIAPDRHGTGTNALLVNAGVCGFAFGENSFVRHVALAEARGARALTCRHPALAFDLDTPEDLAEWKRSGENLPSFLVIPPVPA